MAYYSESTVSYSDDGVADVTYSVINTVTDLLMESRTVDENSTHNDNTTEYRDEKQYNAYQIGVPILSTIIILANVLVIVSAIRVLRRRKNKEKCTFICMANLALSDSLTAFMVGGGAVFPNDKRTVLMCYINLGLILTMTMASLLFVVLMSLDRFVFIVYSMSYEQFMTPTRAKIIAFLAWIVSFIFGFIPVTVWRTDHVETCMFVHIATKECVVFLVVVGIFIPLTFVFASYSIVLRKAIEFLKRKKERHEKNMAGMKYIKGKEEHKKEKGILGLTSQEWRAFSACVIVVVAFIITWMPYFIASIMYLYCSSEIQCKAISTALATTLAMLGLLNSLLNPIIYTWWQKGLWKDIKSIFASCKTKSCLRRRSMDITMDEIHWKQSSSISGNKSSGQTSTSSANDSREVKT